MIIVIIIINIIITIIIIIIIICLTPLFNILNRLRDISKSHRNWLFAVAIYTYTCNVKGFEKVKKICRK